MISRERGARLEPFKAEPMIGVEGKVYFPFNGFECQITRCLAFAALRPLAPIGSRRAVAGGHAPKQRPRRWASLDDVAGGLLDGGGDVVGALAERVQDHTSRRRGCGVGATLRR